MTFPSPERVLPMRRPMPMCRRIKTLFNFEPPVTEQEVRDAALQLVRKLSGFHKPSQATRAAFERAVDETLPRPLACF